MGKAVDLGAVRLAALDLDGTTLRNDKSLSEETERAIRRVSETGVTVVIASGRPYTALPKKLLDMEEIRYAITSNGAAIYDCRTGDRIKEFLLTGRSVDRILELLPEHAVLETFIEGKPFGDAGYVAHPERFGVGPNGVAYIRRTRTPVEGMRHFLAEHREELDSLDVVTYGREETEELKRMLSEQVEEIYLTTSADHLLEISHCGAGKHAAVQWLGEYLGIRREETAAVGDAENDREMIRSAGIGVAVANASGAVKEAADLIVSSNEEDGAASVLRQIAAERGMRDGE